MDCEETQTKKKRICQQAIPCAHIVYVIIHFLLYLFLGQNELATSERKSPVIFKFIVQLCHLGFFHPLNIKFIQVLFFVCDNSHKGTK